MHCGESSLEMNRMTVEIIKILNVIKFIFLALKFTPDKKNSITVSRIKDYT